MTRRELLVRDYRRSWLRRLLRLGENAASTFELDARAVGIGNGNELVVRVDGVVLGKWRVNPPSDRHTFTFPVAAWGRSATVEIQFTDFGVYQIRYFKLASRKTILFEELDNRVLQVLTRTSLPVPATRPATEPNELPIPSEQRLHCDEGQSSSELDPG